MWNKSRSLVLSHVLVWIFMLSLIIGFIILPYLLTGDFNGFVYDANGNSIEVSQAFPIYKTILIWLRISIFPAFIALICLHLLLKNIRKNAVFIPENIKLIRIVSWCCFATAAVLLFLGIHSYLYALFMMGVLITFLGIVLRVLKNVLAQAVTIKTENDLTV